jgi:ComF family protein
MKNLRILTDRLITPLLDFIYPPSCISCNRPLSNSGQKVCEVCWLAIPQVTKELPLYQDTRTKLIADGYINDLVSCFVFEKERPFQDIAHALKYKEYRTIGTELGKRIGCLTQFWNVEIDVIVPVPLHAIKRRERGFNQADLIAYGVASVTGKPIIENAVRRIRHTQTQTKLSITERFKNMEDAFEVPPSSAILLKGKKCLLVDDVITTGATAVSCAKTMSAAGTSSIISASAALAQ